MPVKAKEIAVGSFLYPQNYAAIREVVVLMHDARNRAWWIGYDRKNGEAYDYGFCSVQHLAAWAERFATEEERALIQGAIDPENTYIGLRTHLIATSGHPEDGRV